MRVLILLVSCIYAWSGVIHRAVIDDVEKQLNPSVKDRLHEVLGPLPLSYWASWADEQKIYSYKLHFVKNSDIGHECDNFDDNISCALNTLLYGKNKISEQDRVKLIMHLVVDAHQPLHLDLNFRNPDCRIKNGRDFISLHHWMDEYSLGPKAQMLEISNWIYSIRVKKINFVAKKSDDWLRENNNYVELIYPDFEPGKIPSYCSMHKRYIPEISFDKKHLIAEKMLDRLALASQRLAYELNRIYSY